MAIVGIDCDVVLNDIPYRIDISSWTRRDVVDFAPRGATPAGASIAFSELGLFQTLSQVDFRHGFGFHRFTDGMAYERTAGSIDTRQPDLAMLMTQPVSSETGESIKDGGINFGGSWYTWGSESGSGVRKFTPGGAGAAGTWASVYSGATNNLMTNGTNIFVSPTSARIQESASGGADTWSDAGVDAAATDFKHSAIHGGYVWFTERDKNFLHYASQVDLSDLEGAGATDTAVVHVGPPGSGVTALTSFSNALYAARTDGLWIVNNDEGFTAKRVLNFGTEVHSDNFNSLVNWMGALWFPIRHRVYRWTGATLLDVSPPRLTDTFPFTQYGNFKNFTARGAFLYCSARTNESTYTESILAYDGVGWHKLYDPITDGSGTISMLAIDTDNDFLWYNVDAASDVTGYIELQSLSELAHANFKTSGTHSLFTSYHTMGFERVTKSAREIMVETDNCSASSPATTIVVKYSLDDGGFATLGTVNSSPTQVLQFSSSVEFKKIQLQFDMSTDDTDHSPALKGYHIKYIMRPDVAYGYSFDIIAASDGTYAGLGSNKDAEDIIGEIQTARASTAPVAFTTVLNESKTVYVSSVSEVARARHEDNDVEHRVRVSLVEVG